MNQNWAQALRWALTAVIAVFLVVFARTVDWSAAWSSMRAASPSLLLAAVVANFVSIAIKGIRWWLFLKPAGSPSLGLATRATLAGCGLNNILVANGGDAARVVFVSRATGIPSSRVLASLALERLFDPVGFMILLAYGAIVYPLPEPLERWAVPGQIALVGVLAALVWFVYSSRNASEAGPASGSPVAAERGFVQKARSYIAGFASSTRWLTSGPRFAGALVISLIAWVLQIATFQLAAAAANVTIPPAAILAALLATNLGLLVRATPGNVGFFQFVFALTVVPLGVSRSDAIAVSLLIQSIQIIPLTIIGISLAPEFIFRRSPARDAATAMAHDAEPVLLGSLSEEREKLAAAAREA
ncbi:MAG: lysylphosphatidylglycerol synthase transmembrane domain-containing protein [Gemmatimonadaceae bacterium]